MIDAHTHCFPDALAPRALSKTDLYGGVYETDATISGQIRLAEKEGLRKVVVLHVANRPDSMHHVNDFAVSVNGMAGKVISFASIHPHAPDAAEEVERLYSLGIRGIKFQPIRQGFFMDEPCCEPIFSKIGELGMMTVIHGGRSIRTKEFPVLPRTVARYIDCFQGAPVVLSHLGGMFLSEDEIREAASLPVITDTALCVRHLDQDKFNFAADLFGVDRILFGTDMPWACMAKEKAYIENGPFTVAEKEQIFDGNAERYLRLCHAM